MTLYHKDIYMPKFLRNISFTEIKIDCISYHAYGEYIKEVDKFNIKFLIPATVEVNSNNIIEAEIFDGVVEKLVIRNYLTDLLDLVLVICKNNHKGVVLKTLWINKNDDTHKTLDKSKYAKE